MSTAAPSGYAFSSSQDPDFGGFCQGLEEAQQECQAVATGDLHWALVDGGVWAARDTVNGAVYHIEMRPL